MGYRCMWRPRVVRSLPLLLCTYFLRQGLIIAGQQVPGTFQSLLPQCVDCRYTLLCLTLCVGSGHREAHLRDFSNKRDFICWAIPPSHRWCFVISISSHWSPVKCVANTFSLSVVPLCFLSCFVLESGTHCAVKVTANLWLSTLAYRHVTPHPVECS